jgi:hypothetical protein
MNLINEKQVSERFNIPPGTLRRQRFMKIGFPFKIIGRPEGAARGGIVRYEVSEIEDYLSKKRKL